MYVNHFIKWHTYGPFQRGGTAGGWAAGGLIRWDDMQVTFIIKSDVNQTFSIWGRETVATCRCLHREYPSIFSAPKTNDTSTAVVPRYQ